MPQGGFLAPRPHPEGPSVSGGRLPVHSSHLPGGYSCLPASVSPSSAQQFLVEIAVHLARPYVDPKKSRDTNVP